MVSIQLNSSSDEPVILCNSDPFLEPWYFRELTIIS